MVVYVATNDLALWPGQKPHAPVPAVAP
jgi:hypothetical protein